MVFVDATHVVASAISDTHVRNWGGVWASSDGGNAWSQRTQPSCGGSPANVWGLAVEAGTSNVYAGYDCGLLRSTNAGNDWIAVAGLTTRVIAVAAHHGIVDVYAADGYHRLTVASGAWSTPTATNQIPACDNVAVHAIAASPLDDLVVFAAISNSDLKESDDGGSTWNDVFTGSGDGGRDGWVRTHLSADNDRSHIDVYFGNGEWLKQQTCSGPTSSRSRRCAGSFRDVGLGHLDVNDLAWPSAGNCPAWLSGDGGLMTTSDCGVSFGVADAGNRGLQALLVYQAMAQELDSGGRHYYVALQDNGGAASADGTTWERTGGDVFLFQAPRTAPSDGNQPIMFSGCYDTGCWNQVATPASINHVTWWMDPGDNNCPTSFPCPDSNPILVTGDEWVQKARKTDSDGTTHMRLYRRLGTTGAWNEGVVIPDGLSSWPLPFGADPHTGVWLAQRQDDGRYSLLRVSEIGANPGTVENADDSRLNILHFSSGSFTTGFVLAVDPSDPEHLIAADRTRGKMVSRDHTGAWQEMTSLTTLVTNSGAEALFRDDPVLGTLTSPRVVAFDPVYPGRVFVATEDLGIFMSSDSGLSWSVLPHTDRIRAPTSIWFGNHNDLVVGTYGSGMWSVALPHQQRVSSGVIFPRLWYRDPATGVTLPWPPRPDACPACKVLLPDRGDVIRRLTVDANDRVTSVASGRGALHVLDASGTLGEAPMALRRGPLRPGLAAPSPAPPPKEPIYGLLVDADGKLRGLIVDAPPDKRPPSRLKPWRGATAPSLMVVGNVSSAGGNASHIGGRVVLIGNGFCGDASCGAIALTVGGRAPAKLPLVRADARGRFRVELTAPAQPGSFEVMARQAGKLPRSASSMLTVGFGGERH